MTRALDEVNTTRFSIADLTVSDKSDPRVQDVKLGERLGMSRSRDIRATIKSNIIELQMHGEVASEFVKSTSRGGRPSETYFLNEPQALLICMWSNTPRAASIRKELIEVFMAYRRGMIGKPIKVSEHSRRTSVKVDDAIKLKKNIDRLETATQKIMAQSEKLCAVNIHGARLVVDLSDHSIRQGDYALIIDHRGEVDVQSFDEMQRDVGIRKATSNATALRHGGASRDIVTVVGKVVSPYPEMDLKVLTIMASGPWNNTQIANKTGSTVDHVRYVRQRVFEISQAGPRFARLT